MQSIYSMHTCIAGVSSLAKIHLFVALTSLPLPELLLTTAVKEHPSSNGADNEESQEEEVLGRRSQGRVGLGSVGGDVFDLFRDID